ncbi:MAG: twin-arginine translocase subunit TatC [Gammaproteobacteria bacterium]|nr:twin-arginine translocase subunit TatC [Gammaproteobacteria bacterium]|tara:strand:+ start:924 stop:1742 length:819 start_codon:yes stop_codon:yes gene_type:complete
MNSPDDKNNSYKSVIPHLQELKNRISKCLLFIFIIFLILFPFADQIYNIIAEPLITKLPQDSNMIAIDVASPFFIPFKLVLFLSIFITIPYLLYHMWRFIAPGLYDHERKLVLPILISSSLLFYLGAAFAYFVVFPLIFAFFISIAPEGIAVMTDIGRYLDFVVTLFFAFGFAFEVPIITIILVMTNATTKENLIKKRPYVIVGAFILGMLLTPPDVISQVLLAIPIWILYELGIFFSTFVSKPKQLEVDEELVDDVSTSSKKDIIDKKDGE